MAGTIGAIDHMNEARPTGQEKYLAALPALAMFCVGVFAYFLRSSSYLSAVPGDLGDARFNSVILEHVYQWITGAASDLWSPRFFYPAANLLGFSDAHFGTAGIYAFLRWSGLQREEAFIGWYAIGCTLNFIAAYLSLRWLKFGRAASSIGAFVFAFALPALAQEGHAQLNYRLCVPIAAAALYKWINEDRPRLLICIVLLVIWQFFISIYLGLFLVYLLGAMFIAFFLLNEKSIHQIFLTLQIELQKSRLVERWGAAVILFASALALGALLLRYRAIAKSYGLLHGSTEQLATMLPRPQSYLLSWARTANWMHEFLPAVPMEHEQLLFVGFSVFVLLLVAVFQLGCSSFYVRAARVSAVSLAILILGTLSINGYSIYFILAKLPGFGSVRAPSRIILIMLWPVAVLVAFAVQRLFEKTKKRDRAIPVLCFLAIAGSLGFETWGASISSVPIEQWRARQLTLQDLWSARSPSPNSVLAVSGRRDEPRHFAELDAMIFAQDHFVATTNGYSGYGTPGYFLLDRCTSLATLIGHYENVIRDPNLVDKMEYVRQTGIRLALEPCPISLDNGPAQEVTPVEAVDLRLRLLKISKLVSSVEFVVEITNTGPTVINTRSGRGHPLNLAWRFNDLAPVIRTP